MEELSSEGRLSAGGLEVFAQALLAGGCPRLRSFKCHSWTSSDLPGDSALAAILAGRAPCSTSLREFNLSGTTLHPPAIMQLAAALSEPTAVRLNVLGLKSAGPGGEDLLAVIESLQHRAGAFLRKLDLKTNEDLEVVDRALVEALERGCCPQLHDLYIEEELGSHPAWRSTEALEKRRERERAW